MIWLIVLVSILGIAVFAFHALYSKSDAGATISHSQDDAPHIEDGASYTRKVSLFSPAERCFLDVLCQAVGERYAIFGKVRVADVVNVRAGSDLGARIRAQNRLNAKRFDFVLCARDDLSIACVIEPDDRWHESKGRRERDTFLDELCALIGLPLVRIPTRAGYTVSQIRQRILEVLGQSASPQQRLSPAKRPTLVAVPPLFGKLEMAPPKAGSPESPSVGEESSRPAPRNRAKPHPTHSPDPSCPRCSAPMVRRTVTAGPREGTEFWGCSTFPRCRAVVRMADAAPSPASAHAT